MPKKLTIAEMQKIAQERGGKCLSDTYVNSKTHLLWQCSEGHQWETTPKQIKRGKWCPHCAGNLPLTIEEMQKLAEKHNGKCLSDTYINNSTKLLWQCSEGHQWEATPQHIKDGTWCPYCAGKIQTIDDMHKIAQQRGGICLSNTYVNSQTPLLWQCSKGHQWKAVPNSVKQGSWCPHCSGRLPLTIEDMQKIAQEKGGKCLSKTYINTDTHLLWQCANGHQWKAVPNSVKNQGTWCPQCAGNLPSNIEEMQEIAEKRGGKCLSENYRSNHKHLLWQCAEGHKWRATPAHIKQGEWCPQCAGNVPLTLEEMQKIAKEHGGECLSKIYINYYAKLLWKCAKGHQWKTAPANIKHGTWCPQCGGNFPLSLEKIQIIAQERGGKCLSNAYVNANTPLLWECAQGHQWEAIPSSVKNNRTWCPQCGGSFPLTIEEMREIAQERGGQCLSETYINNQTLLLWECANKHQWKAIPSNVKGGTWCPSCQNRYESICRDYFKALFNTEFLKVKPLWLKNEGGNRLELDGFDEKLGIAFEHNGLQHYEFHQFFHESEADFQKQQQHDEIKRQTCEKYGVLLIEIPQLFLITNPKDLPILVKQALEDANYPLPKKIHQVIVRKDGLVIDESDNENKHEEEKEELIEQLEIW